MMKRLAPALVLIGCLGSCESTGGATRKAASGLCDSDRDCLYGLVCRGAAVGEPGERRCVYEQYSRCRSTRDCYPGRTCHEGRCQVECVADADCLGAMADAGMMTWPDGGQRVSVEEVRCVVGECRTGSAETQCLAASDCNPEQDCQSGRCVTRTSERCINDFDCPDIARCVGGVCR